MNITFNDKRYDCTYDYHDRLWDGKGTQHYIDGPVQIICILKGLERVAMIEKVHKNDSLRRVLGPLAGFDT